MITLRTSQVEAICSHARETAPAECCGLVGGTEDSQARNVYRLGNVSTEPLVSYEAAPEELFSAQRRMRERGEQLLAIYHSHPRSTEPTPSETDVRLAFYPSAVYLIIGLGAVEASMRAFRISEREQCWERVVYQVVGE